GLPRFSALHSLYNMMDRSRFEGDLGLVARAQTLGVMPHSALAHGFLAGRSRAKTSQGSAIVQSKAADYLNRRGLRILSRLDAIASEHHLPVSTISLAWLLSKPTIAAPV